MIQAICYVLEMLTNLDSKIDKKNIPDHTLLVGGFPCQDYSVARGLSGEKGIQGKKGVLWWEIYNILKVKKPPFVLLENVDRIQNFANFPFCKTKNDGKD